MESIVSYGASEKRCNSDTLQHRRIIHSAALKNIARWKPPLYLKDGDTIEVRIAKVGHLVNRVREE